MKRKSNKMYCHICGVVVPWEKALVGGGVVYCSHEHADLDKPDPVAKAAFEQKLALMRARRLQPKAE